MKLLERYIAKTVLASIAMVTFLLSGLQVFILFIKQLGDLGHVGFGILQATVFVLMQTPHQVYQFFPIVSLLGVLIGLGVLASNSELVVMRASGMSILKISFAVLKAAFLVIFVVTILGETVIPRMAYYANDRKMQEMSGGQALRTARGVWLRSHNDFIFIGAINSESSLDSVFQFHFDTHYKLVSARKIQKVVYQNKQWQAVGIEQTEFLPSQTKSSQLASTPWDVAVQPWLLKMSSIEPDEMNLLQLHKYLHEKKRNHQSALNYETVYFQRLLQPFSTAVMMMLAIPFIFGPLRSSTMGAKMLIGLTVGFSFHILNQLSNLAGQIYQLPPILAVPAPILLFAGLGLYLMRRVR